MHAPKKVGEIPVVLTADNNYIIPLAVTAMSLLKSANDNTRYRIIVLVDEGFDENEFFRILNFCDNTVFSFIRIKKKLLENACINNEAYSIFTYCRLLIPQLLPEIEKCIYLDTDTVVLEDLSNMYTTNVEEYYIAGVKDYAIQNRLKKKKEELSALGIESEKQYVNAGVLLFNLKKIREDKVDLLLLGNIGKKWRLEDQDILNKCCYGKIFFLELKYNIFYRYYKNVQAFGTDFYKNEELEDALRKPVIVHYTGPKMKPWKNTRIRAAKLWWNVAEEVLPKEEKDKLKENIEFFERGIQWNYVLSQCKGKKIIIFGFSAIGRKVFGWLRNSSIDVCYFCDNDKTKEGNVYENITVKSLDEFVENGNDYMFLIVSQNAAGEIRKQLLETGIKNILTYYDKDEYYYMALDSELFEEEIAEIEVKENVEKKFFTKEIEDKFWMSRWIYGRKKS